MSVGTDVSKTVIIDECKRIALKHLWKSFGRETVLSLVLHGSVARNEESYASRKGKPALENDIDLVAVIKNIDIVKYMRSFGTIENRIRDDLRRKFELSNISLIVITEKRLLHSRPSVLCQELKFNGKVIFGKDVINLLPNYRNDQIPVRDLMRYIFTSVVRLLESFVRSEVKRERLRDDENDPVLKHMEKMILILIRAIVMKEGIPINPFNLNEIRSRSKDHVENSDILEYLLKSYEDLTKIKNSSSQYSRIKMKKYWVNIIDLFNSTMIALTGNKDVCIAPSEKQFFGDTVKLGRRVQLASYVSPRFLGKSMIIDLGKAVMRIILFGPDHASLAIYHLFLSVPSVLTDMDAEDSGDYRHGYSSKLWLKSLEKDLNIWNHTSCVVADYF